MVRSLQQAGDEGALTRQTSPARGAAHAIHIRVLSESYPSRPAQGWQGRPPRGKAGPPRRNSPHRDLTRRPALAPRRDGKASRLTGSDAGPRPAIHIRVESYPSHIRVGPRRAIRVAGPHPPGLQRRMRRVRAPAAAAAAAAAMVEGAGVWLAGYVFRPAGRGAGAIGGKGPLGRRLDGRRRTARRMK